MCGAPKEQVITQKTVLDPALRRYLYGGSLDPQGNYVQRGSLPVATQAADPTSMSGGGGGGGGDDRDSNDMFSGGSGSFASSGLRSVLPGGINTVNPESRFNQAAATLFDRPQGTPTADSRPGSKPSGFGIETDASGQSRTVRMAMGGPVMPQMGIASLNQGQMPMMGGQLPNLSDPMTAATLAMAIRGPQMQYGNIMSPPMGYAMGGYVEGPGTGTSDSIDAVIMQNGRPVQEALLSDGEFVMTERAVRGAGNGNREAGAARMYDMMRQFERGGRV